MLLVRQTRVMPTSLANNSLSCLGNYASGAKPTSRRFITRAWLKRPLFPAQWDASDDVKEVLDTYAKQASTVWLIISMASEPSDVMAVQLLLQESCRLPMPGAIVRDARH